LQNSKTTTGRNRPTTIPTITAAPPRFTKRIGSTTYRVNVHFSKTSRETANDKIARLVRSETAAGKAVNI
jgi:hypothetical protein